MHYPSVGTVAWGREQESISISYKLLLILAFIHKGNIFVIVYWERNYNYLEKNKIKIALKENDNHMKRMMISVTNSIFACTFNE